MVKMNREIIVKIMYFLGILLGIYVIIMLITKLSGHSPSEYYTMIGLCIAILLYLYKIRSDQCRFEGRTEEFMKTAKNTFCKIGDDIEYLKKEIAEAKLERAEMKKDISYIKNDIRWIKKKLAA